MEKFKCTIRLVLVFAGMLFVIAAPVVNASAQASDKRIEAIRKIYDETNGLIAEMEKETAFSSIFVVELTVNKHLSPYPAVGIFQTRSTFYYTYGDREKNPYPDRLLKISGEYRRSARTEKGEFYFNAAGELVFVLVTNPGSAIEESKAYFAAGRLIKLTDDGKEIDLKRQHAVEVAMLAKAEASRLTGIFRASLHEVN